MSRVLGLWSQNLKPRTQGEAPSPSSSFYPDIPSKTKPSLPLSHINSGVSRILCIAHCCMALSISANRAATAAAHWNPGAQHFGMFCFTFQSSLQGKHTVLPPSFAQPTQICQLEAPLPIQSPPFLPLRSRATCSFGSPYSTSSQALSVGLCACV